MNGHHDEKRKCCKSAACSSGWKGTRCPATAAATAPPRLPAPGDTEGLENGRTRAGRSLCVSEDGSRFQGETERKETHCGALLGVRCALGV